MKKTLFDISIMAALVGLQMAMAQTSSRVSNLGYFDHLAVGLNVGTPGIGLEVAAPITDFVAIRVGYSLMPELKYKTDVNYTVKGKKEKTEVEGKLHMGDAKLLLDFYPLKASSFHLTGGFFLGKEEVVTAENTTPVTTVDGGLEIGDYIIGFDRNGYAKASIEVAKFKPYVGLGFGRAVPRRRLSVDFEVGAQFWGSPKVYEHQTGTKQRLTKNNTGDNDGGEAIRVISKITAYPVLNLRISGRIF